MKHFSFALLRCPAQSLQDAYVNKTSLSTIVEEGIYLSSVDFYKEHLRRGLLTVKEREKLDLSLGKYWLRSCTRCTPYGTFAGSTVVDITKGPTKLILNSSEDHKRRIRIDMNYVAEIISALEKIPLVRRQLKFYTNNSLYELGDDYRYAEYVINKNIRNYHLTSIPKSKYTQIVIDKARCGASIESLIDLLVAYEDVSRAEANVFLTDMQQSQLLVSELEPCITGEEPLDALIKQLQHLQDVSEILDSLIAVQNIISKPIAGVEPYQAIEDILKNINLTVEIPKNTLQADLFLSTQHNKISLEIADAITNQMQDILCIARKGRNVDLEDFKNKFLLRYEESEVPLAVALDADMGIGYANVKDETSGGDENIEDIAAARNISLTFGREISYVEKFAAKKYSEYLKFSNKEIEITEDELNDFKKQIIDFEFPSSLYTMGSLLSENNQLDKDNFAFNVTSFGGPSAGNLLGRFTHGDSRLKDMTKAILKAEESESPEAIFAEVVHLPQARTGNILLRPLLREYEIAYVGKSGAAASNQILIDDLMVSVQQGIILLRSKKHNKQIIPRLTTAHNFSYQSLPTYKFLCDLQTQGIAYPNAWDWGSLSTLAYLPRVRYKNLILQKAIWRITEKDIADLPKNKKDYLEYFSLFCAKQLIPNRVVYTASDNELLIDFTQELGIDLFLHYLRRDKIVQLEEFLFTEENCIVTDLAGRPYTNQILLPLHRETGKNIEAQQFSSRVASSVRRKYAPNSEWQYFKIYCGSKTAEKILHETVLPFVEDGIARNLFEKFFFVRYRDDFGHIRIRFFNSDRIKQSALQNAFMLALQPMLESNLIDKILIDTYSRELERYGGSLIDDTEHLYHCDSLAVLRFLALLEGTDSNKYKLLFAMRGIDMLFDDFSFNLSQKQQVLKALQTGFFKEFGGQPSLQKRLNEKYRKQQQDIFSHMNPDNDAENEIAEAVYVFKIRSLMNAPIIASILSKIPDAKAERLMQLLPSYIHMFLNRLFTSQQRKYELVVYHFLDKYYTSLLAIEKNKTDSSKLCKSLGNSMPA